LNLEEEELHTSLGNCNEIMAGQNSRDGIGLNGSGDAISTQLDVAQHDRVKPGIRELDRERQ
jgi:hypothetical protein